MSAFDDEEEEDDPNTEETGKEIADGIWLITVKRKDALTWSYDVLNTTQASYTVTLALGDGCENVKLQGAADGALEATVDSDAMGRVAVATVVRADATKACKVRVGVSMEEKRAGAGADEAEAAAAGDEAEEEEAEAVHTTICEGLFVMSQRRGASFAYDVVNQTGQRFRVTLELNDECRNVALAGDDPDAFEAAVVCEPGTRTPAATVVQVDTEQACSISMGIKAVPLAAHDGA